MNKKSFILSKILIWKHIAKRYLQTLRSQSKTNPKFSKYSYDKNFQIGCSYSTLVHKKESDPIRTLKTHQNNTSVAVW